MASGTSVVLGAVGGQGHAADDGDILNHVVHIHGLVGHGKAGGAGGMGVDHAHHVGPLFVAAQVHLHLAGGAQALLTLQDLQVFIHPQQLFRGDKALAHAGGGAQEGAVVQPGGNVAVVGGHPAQLPHLVAHIANLVFQLVDTRSIHGGTLLSSVTITCIISD